MSQIEQGMTEKESLDLITTMINRAKQSCHDTGISAIMWGSLIAFCALEKLCEMQFGYKLPFDIYLLTLVAVIPQVLIDRREKKMRKVKTYDDVYQGAIWLTFGISIFLLIFLLNVLFNAWVPAEENYFKTTGQHFPFNLNEYIASFFLLLYGVPTFITGMAMKFRPMVVGGILCWICCLASMFTQVKIDMLLVAFAAIAAWLIPGIILENNYRKARKELEDSHV
jgi:hypothetical protein